MSGCGSTAKFGKGLLAHVMVCRDHRPGHELPCGTGTGFRWGRPEVSRRPPDDQPTDLQR